ncbi:MAG: methyltransferase domain-containing protein [Nitrososphaeraceae archaeon]
MSIIDPERYKAGQRQGWDCVASGWQKWWKTTETASEKISKRLVELAAIKQGSRVLDIATGIGEPSITAAYQVGNSGHVIAIDLSSQMLSVAKQRAISLDLQDVIEFKEGDTETIDLPALSFDAALCRFGLMFLPNLKAGLSNIYKSLVDGGRFAAAVWASSDKVPFISLPLNTLLKETNSPPPPAGTPGPFSLSDEKLLKESFIKSGFEDVTIERLDMVFNFDSAEGFTNFVYETAAPIQLALSNQSQERRKEILRAVAEAASKYADKSSGSVSLSNEAICIIGRR